MTTIRERSTAALAEALRSLGDRYPIFRQSPSGGDLGGEVWYEHGQLGTAVLAASPTVGRRMDFGTAWDDAEAELPEGTTLSLGAAAGSWVASYQHVHTACERCGVLHQCEDSGYVKGWGGTPIDALVALAEALRERAR